MYFVNCDNSRAIHLKFVIAILSLNHEEEGSSSNLSFFQVIKDIKVNM
jgi:hypothetical protein